MRETSPRSSVKGAIPQQRWFSSPAQATLTGPMLVHLRQQNKKLMRHLIRDFVARLELVPDHGLQDR
jgi:hypothetical protein